MSDRTDLYNRAIDYWGEGFQIDMVIEECCELIHEILKLKRNKSNYDKICEEIADVRIMLSQLDCIIQRHDCSIPPLSEIKQEQKLKRLKELLDKEVSNSSQR